MKHQLRDLAGKIEELARDHPAYSQAHLVVQNCIDHLSAMAAFHELNSQLLGLQVEVRHAAERVSELNDVIARSETV